MPPPRSIPCEICGKGFFKLSYPIHLKQCKVKQATSFFTCKNCNLPVSNDEYSEHFTKCQFNQATEKERKETELELISREADELGRIRCEICKRGFSKDRISKHELICIGIASKSKRMEYPSTATMRVKGTVYEGYQNDGGGLNKIY